MSNGPFSQGALQVSARELEQRVNTVKSDLDKMSKHIDLTTPKLRHGMTVNWIN